MPHGFLSALSAILPKDNLKTDPDSLAHFGKDWSSQFAPKPCAIAFPTNTQMVQQIVQLCRAHRIVITPSGGRTGLSAGAVASNGELVLSLDKMNQVLEFYPNDTMVKVQAGMVTEALQQFALDKGLYYPVDFASSGSSQIGGNIATNAGGIKVIRYGMTRDWVRGLTVVTGKGDILHLNGGLIKNATGYDLRHLFIGSEGTLGIITEADIALTRPPQDLSVIVLGVDDFAHMMAILDAFREKITLTAFEFFNDVALDKHLQAGVKAPFETRTRFYALLEFEAVGDTTDHAMAVFEQCFEEGWVIDAVMSQSLAQAQELWHLREGISETIAPFTPYKNDISVLVGRVPEFLSAIDTIVQSDYPDFEVCWYGHIGDGNLHLNILKPDNLSKDEFLQKCQTVNTKVFDTVAKFNGSISAEHGVGMTKKPYLHYSRSLEQINYMRAIKSVFDPDNIMNTGKIFD